jgi:hypothetical protein
MTTLDQVVALVRDLSPSNLDRVRQFIESLHGESARANLWSFDFIANFNEATRTGLQVQVEDATCEGITRPALWEHPPASGSANVSYLVPIPPSVNQLKLKFSIGIRDGSELPNDRFVAFRVMVNGWKLWSTLKNSHSWQEHVIAMPHLSSDIARVEFVTDGMGDNRWNWAVWAEPRLEGESGVRQSIPGSNALEHPDGF